MKLLIPVCIALVTQLSCTANRVLFTKDTTIINPQQFATDTFIIASQLLEYPYQLLSALKKNGLYLTDLPRYYNSTDLVDNIIPNCLFITGGTGLDNRKGYMIFNIGGFVEQRYILFYEIADRKKILCTYYLIPLRINELNNALTFLAEEN